MIKILLLFFSLIGATQELSPISSSNGTSDMAEDKTKTDSALPPQNFGYEETLVITEKHTPQR